MPTSNRLQAQSFAAYPPRGRALASANLVLLRWVPLPLLPILLRELSTFDFRFPREQERMRGQLQWLSAMPEAEHVAVFAPFRALSLPDSLAAGDWVNDAPRYMEQLTAVLWSTHQMPAFREAADGYAQRLAEAQPELSPTQPRLVLVVMDGALGSDAEEAHLYRKLRPKGVLLSHVDPTGGLDILTEHLKQRSRQVAEPFAHWHIDGDEVTGFKARGVAPEGVALARESADLTANAVVSISYAALQPVRQKLLERARQAMSAERSGPEELRTLMARLTPLEMGLDPVALPVLAQFQLSLLTEGSGTQVFSTTFVQWAARECLRRAEPTTLLARFSARQAQQDMNHLLSGAPSTGMDAAGSLVDAEQGAYYTWLNLQRLSGADQSRFLVWQQGRTSAVAIGPDLPRGTVSNSRINMHQVLALLT